MKTIGCFISATIVLGCTSTRVTENRQLLKEYAYCKCYQFATGDTTFFTKDVSVSVYFDLANYNFEAYSKIDSLTKEAITSFRPFEVPDYENKKAVFWNCFQFYKSKQLGSTVIKLDKEIRKGW